jgi:uncharacterized membrane protein
MASSRAERDAFGAAAALERLVFFSDAVFAIAMTLLVLNIPHPAPGQNVAAFLTTQDGKFVAFFISFWVIALFWMGHHRLFRFVREYDHGLIMLNLALLFCVAFLPYPSAILGDHPTDVGATVFYAAAISVTGFASASLTWYTVIHRHFTGPLHPAMARYYVFRGLAAPLVFLLSIPLAFVNTTAAQASWYLLFVLQFIGRRIAERRAGVDRSR